MLLSDINHTFLWLVSLGHQSQKSEFWFEPPKKSQCQFCEVMKNSWDIEIRRHQLWIWMVNSRTDRCGSDVLQRPLVDGRTETSLVNDLQCAQAWVEFVSQTVELFHVTMCCQPSGTCWWVQSVGRYATCWQVCFPLVLYMTCCRCRCKIFQTRDSRQVWRMLECTTDDWGFPYWFVFPDMQSFFFCFVFSDGVQWVLTSELPDESNEDAVPRRENRFVSSILSTFQAGRKKKAQPLMFSPLKFAFF